MNRALILKEVRSAVNVIEGKTNARGHVIKHPGNELTVTISMEWVEADKIDHDVFVEKDLSIPSPLPNFNHSYKVYVPRDAQ